MQCQHPAQDKPQRGPGGGGHRGGHGGLTRPRHDLRLRDGHGLDTAQPQGNHSRSQDPIRIGGQHGGPAVQVQL